MPEYCKYCEGEAIKDLMQCHNDMYNNYYDWLETKNKKNLNLFLGAMNRMNDILRNQEKLRDFSQQQPNGSVHCVGFAASHDNKEKAAHIKKQDECLTGEKDE
jgi:hypothetical protein